MGACAGCRVNPIDEAQREKINEVITYWYGDLEEWDRHTTKAPQERTKGWFDSNKDDEQIEKFQAALEKVGSGEYNGWEHDHDGRLAAVLLCDQMSRSIYRRQG